MKHRLWYKISINIDESFQDLLVGQLTITGFEGFVQEQTFLSCYISADKWNPAVVSKLNATLNRFKSEFPSLDLAYKTEKVREENWNKTWEKQTGIVEATSNIIIKPSWKKVEKRFRNKIIIHVDPKMSFGTGHHETTRLSLKLIEQFIKPGMNVLDFGCGTGILGIACIRLGAKSALAIDFDKWAIENTRENIKRNKVQSKMKAKLGSISAVPHLKYSLIAANIDFQTISKFIKSISGHLKKEGIIILSGILTADMPSLVTLFEKNKLIIKKTDRENEWSAIALSRI